MPCLVVLEGPAAGQRFALADHRIVMIGRDDQCTFQIVDDQVSRRHMQVKREDDGDGHDAVDFGSANGVFINGNRIGTDVRLHDGDRIRIGETTIVYSVTDDPDAQHIEDVMRRRGERRRSTLAGS